MPSQPSTTRRPNSLEDATQAAERIVKAVLSGDSFEVHAQLRDPATDVLATVMVLADAAAAAVPTGSTLAETLSWSIHPGKECAADGAILRKVLHHNEADWTADELRAAHAAYNRGDRDLATIEGERVHQRLRGRRRRSETRRRRLTAQPETMAS